MNSPEEYINNNSREPGQGWSNPDINKLPSSITNISDVNSLDKVRDILFGNQVRDIDKRFARLEERLLKEFANVRDETRKRLDSLEIYIKKEVEALTESLKNEQKERDSGVTLLVQEQKNIALSLEKKLAQLDEQTSKSQREMREQILTQSKSLQDEIQEKYAEIVKLLERESDELRRDKTDRSSLASLFTELAIRLNSEPKS